VAAGGVVGADVEVVLASQVFDAVGFGGGDVE
jgi:hypothetical protein